MAGVWYFYSYTQAILYSSITTTGMLSAWTLFVVRMDKWMKTRMGMTGWPEMSFKLNLHKLLRFFKNKLIAFKATQT